MTSGDRSTTSSNATFEWLATANAAMSEVVASLIDAPFSPAIEAIDHFRDELNAVEALRIAKRSQEGHSKRSTEGVIKRSGGVSKAEAKKRTTRAAAVEKNPGLAKKLCNGEMSTEQVDLVADASEKTDGAAANDDQFIDDVSNSNPDLGKATVRKYVEDHTDGQATRNERYARQRAKRKAYKERTAYGMSRLVIEGDDESVDAMFGSLRKRADGMYRADGGRDVPNADHDRTNAQRLFDAANEKLTGQTDNSQTDNSQAAAPSTATSDERQQQACPAQPANRPGERPTMVFTGKLSDLSDDPEQLAAWEAELIGTGIVPTPVASYYRCISDFAGQLMNDKGEVLWKGRSVRRATPGQWVSLVIRDRGCVRCGAEATTCEAHHLLPFNAPAKGESNVDNMALLCVDCHHWVHEADKTMVWDSNSGSWAYRQARWEERAPKQRKPSPDRRAASKQNEPSNVV